MYTVTVKRDFIARHYLIGGDLDDENLPHVHNYVVEVRLEGGILDNHGYLTDIVEIESALDAQVARYRDATLNELPEFEDLNPSIEHLARILCQAIADDIQTRHLKALTVRVWENEWAWAQYREEF